jgi:hypothetical protein
MRATGLVARYGPDVYVVYTQTFAPRSLRRYDPDQVPRVCLNFDCSKYPWRLKQNVTVCWSQC